MSAPSSDSLNGDMTARVAVDGASLAWMPSPSSTVWRKRLHRVGSAEAGQVTSVVRYDAGAAFPAHDHPEGEEILVLEGVFSDEHGDWPAGTYLQNPEGFRHAPFSKEGCVIFVKLRQAAGDARRHEAIRTDRLAWQPTERPGIACKRLSDQPEYPDATCLERWAPGTRAAVSHPGGVEIFVVEGVVADDTAAHGPASWLRLPPNDSLDLESAQGCTLYVKYGGVAALRSEP